MKLMGCTAIGQLSRDNSAVQMIGDAISEALATDPFMKTYKQDFFVSPRRV